MQQGRRCNLGGTELDPNRLIVEHPEKDLATYELSDVLLGNVWNIQLMEGATLTNINPLRLRRRTLKPPKEGAPVLYGGISGLRTSNLSTTAMSHLVSVGLANKGRNASDVEHQHGDES